MTKRSNAVDLVVLGPAKSGTSSLFAAFEAHPRIDPAHGKEPVFFSTDLGLDRGAPDGPDRSGTFDRGLPWYEALFRGGPDTVRLEGSTAYFASPTAPTLLSAAAPGVHVVVSLRDPVDRLVSHYWHERRATLLPDLAIMAKDGHPRLDHWLRCSSYATHLRGWLERLPESQMHVVGFDQIRADVTAVANDVLGAMGLDPLGADVALDDDSRNVAGLSRSPRLQRLLTVSSLRRRAETLPDWLQRPLRSVARGAMQANLERSAYPPTDQATRDRLRAFVANDHDDLVTLTEEHWPRVTDEVRGWVA